MNKTTLLLSFIFLFLLSGSLVHSQNISTVAGNGIQGYSGNGGPATAAELYLPYCVVADGSGNIFISDYGNNSIRKVSTNGDITTIAGNGSPGYSGDGGLGTAAELDNPCGIALDANGNLYFADYMNHRIRKLTTGDTIITVAGNGVLGYAGDNGPATAAELNENSGVALDGAGNIYIADYGNFRIRLVNTAGIISTYSGNGVSGYSGDGGPATAAEMESWCVGADAAGNVYISDYTSPRIRIVSTGGIINTIAGNGLSGFSGDGGPATAAEFNLPACVAVDGAGNIYIADQSNNRIREVNTGGIINSVAGNGSLGYSGDGGPATAAELNMPWGVALSASGNLFIGDKNNNVIREVIFAPPLAIESGNLKNQDISIYPNPNNGKFQIAVSYQPSANSQIEIFNMLGDKVVSISAKCGINEMDLSGLPSGMYLVQVTGTAQTYRQKIVVLH